MDSLSSMTAKWFVMRRIDLYTSSDKILDFSTRAKWIRSVSHQQADLFFVLNYRKMNDIFLVCVKMLFLDNQIKIIKSDI